MDSENYYRDEKIYEPNAINKILKISVNKSNLKGNTRGEYMYNIPASFDIETTSFYRDANGDTYSYEQYNKLDCPSEMEKLSNMYVWQFGINGRVIVGRYWSELLEMLQYISNALQLTKKRKLVVYVHNLSYEFQFIRNLFNWIKVFSMDVRKPLYALTDLGIEFRCSYLLSGY